MTYDADGLRSTKTVGTRKTEYQYVGDKLFYEKRGDNQTFYYFYDSFGNLSMIRYTLVGSDNSVSTATYLAQTNSQGDVVALYKKSGELYARYEYDAWGNTLSVTDANGNEITAWYNIANANPIRYRGYYFDADLNLYYLQSRYYDSEIGRFINSDNVTDPGAGLLGYNTFIYCANNPVNAADPSGHAIETVWDVFSIGVGILDVYTNPTDPWAWVGLTADLLDLIPFVTCLGETVRALRTIEGIANITQVSNRPCNLPNSSTTIYRSISSAEADDIISTGRFNLSPSGMEAKQFGLNYDETVMFGNTIKPTQHIVVSAELPTSMVPQFYNGGTGGIDTTIFKSGTLTVYGEQLDDFNDAIRGTIKFMP